MVAREQLREVADQLRALVDSSPQSPESVAAWTLTANATCDAVHERFPDVRLPIQVMHYVHDADIRSRDKEYAASQDRTMRQIIADFERGIVPVHRDIILSLTAKDLVLLVLIAGALIAALWMWAA